MSTKTNLLPACCNWKTGLFFSACTAGGAVGGVFAFYGLGVGSLSSLAYISSFAGGSGLILFASLAVLGMIIYLVIKHYGGNPQKNADPFAGTHIGTPSGKLGESSGWKDIHRAVLQEDLKKFKSTMWEEADFQAVTDEDENAFYLAAKFNKLDILIYLFERGSKIKCAKPKGVENYHPLHIAVQMGNKEIIERLLLIRQIDVNVQDSLGRTPLDISAQFLSTSKKEEINLLLKKYGADNTLTNNDKKTPFQVFTSRNDI